jgi:hypothetical protein
MICGSFLWRATRAAALALLLSSICPAPVLAASAIDTLAAQMSQAADNARDEEGLAIAQKLEGLVRRQQGTDNMNYADPSVWAPFVLVGEGLTPLCRTAPGSFPDMA